MVVVPKPNPGAPVDAALPNAGAPNPVAELAGAPNPVAELAGAPNPVAELAGAPNVLAELAGTPNVVAELAGAEAPNPAKAGAGVDVFAAPKGGGADVVAAAGVPKLSCSPAELAAAPKLTAGALAAAGRGATAAVGAQLDAPKVTPAGCFATKQNN